MRPRGMIRPALERSGSPVADCGPDSVVSTAHDSAAAGVARPPRYHLWTTTKVLFAATLWEEG